MQLYQWLGFDSKTMSVRTELIAGATTFLTMCYVLAVNPTVLSNTGMDRAALFTSTALASAVATMLLAFLEDAGCARELIAPAEKENAEAQLLREIVGE